MYLGQHQPSGREPGLQTSGRLQRFDGLGESAQFADCDPDIHMDYRVCRFALNCPLGRYESLVIAPQNLQDAVATVMGLAELRMHSKGLLEKNQCCGIIAARLSAKAEPV
jgi:hypothetical protein